jgi:predicted dehydrogenase
MPQPNRREFLGRSLLFTGGVLLSGCHAPHVSRGRVLGANDRLRIASVGVGGKGWTDVNRVGHQDIVGICDVDANNLAKAGAKFPSARRFADWREMFDQLGNTIDAVTVSTPDHTHFPPSIRAIRHGWHLFCQKPLTHTVWEARELTRAAKAAGVATQMGNQGISHPLMRRDAELVKGGAVGTVRELHCWTDRPGNWWPQGIQRPTDRPPVPKELSWDLWLGTAPERPYHPAWAAFKWRAWWDFGTGAVGDMGCHLLNLAGLVLDMAEPTSVEVVSVEGANDETGPLRSHIVWDMPARKGRPAFKFHWYDGGSKPSADLFPGTALDRNGVLVVGSSDTLLTSFEGGASFRSGRRYEDFAAIPELFEKYTDFEPSHYAEWIRACKGGPRALSSFDTAGPITETILLGNIAVRTGKRLEWDSKNLRVTNVEEANRLVRTRYRPGFVG